MKFVLIVFSLILFLVTFPFPQSPAAIAETNTPCELTWDLVSSPNLGTSSRFDAIDAAAADDIWAIGTLGENRSQLLLEHWDGAQWSQVSAPDVGNNGLRLEPTAIETISSTDAWAVGYYSPNFFPDDAFAIHWDGSAWHTVALPVDSNLTSRLVAISGTTLTDVWVVGIEDNHGLVLHWNGTQWEKISNPIAGIEFQRIFRVAANAPNDVWLIGEYAQNSPEGDNYFAAVVHWDGSIWSTITQYQAQTFSSDGTGGYDIIQGFVVLNTNDIWVLVWFRPGASRIGSYLNTRVLHWDGVTWQTVEYVNYRNWWRPVDLKGASSDSIWVIPYDTHGADDPQFTARKWDGAAYFFESLPMPNGTALLKSVTVISADDVWIVGETYNYPNPNQPYIAHAHLPCVQVPVAPALLSPPRKAITKPKPRLDWSDVTGAHYYELVISRNLDSTEPTLAAITRSSDYKFSMSLRGGVTYYWHVRACNNAGCGEWSHPRRFAIQE